MVYFFVLKIDVYKYFNLKVVKLFKKNFLVVWCLRMYIKFIDLRVG